MYDDVMRYFRCFCSVILVLALSGCDTPELEGSLDSVTVPEEGMMATSDGREIVAWFRRTWPGMPKTDIYFTESVPKPGRTFAPGYRSLAAYHARPDPEDADMLNLGMIFTVVVTDNDPAYLKHSVYDTYIRYSRSDFSPTIAAWQKPFLPQQLRAIADLEK